MNKNAFDQNREPVNLLSNGSMFFLVVVYNIRYPIMALSSLKTSKITHNSRYPMGAVVASHFLVSPRSLNTMLPPRPLALLLALLLLVVSAAASSSAQEDMGFEIQTTFVLQTYASVQLSAMAYDGTPSDAGRHGFQVYGEIANTIVTTEDGEDDTTVTLDFALVAKKDDTCYVAWSGTDQELREEWDQNFDTSAKTVGNCQVHNGFDRNYSQRDKVDAAINDCLASCGADTESDGSTSNNACPLVLTGSSQGGATAAIASLYWIEQNPIVITFGAPRAVHSNCNLLQANNHYRFVSVDSSGDRMKYDFVPMLPTGGQHYGHTFLVSDDADVAYLGWNDNVTRMAAAMPSVSLHLMDAYSERIELWHSQMEAVNLPIDIFGWDDDETCGFDDECSSERCEDARCQPLLESCDTCRNDSDCTSGQCVYFLSSLRSVCASDSSGKMDDGCICDRSSDCQSGRCSGWAWNRKCQ